VLDQPDGLSVPLSPFLVLAQALIAAGPPPGFDGDNEDDGDNDYDEVNDDDEDDDMPSLETAMPSTAPPPPTLQATTDANMAQSVANALESLMTASQNPQNGTAVGFPPSLPLMPFSFVFGPTLTISPDGGASINEASVLPSETATSIGEFAADLQAAGVDTQLIAQITSSDGFCAFRRFSAFPTHFRFAKTPFLRCCCIRRHSGTGRHLYDPSGRHEMPALLAPIRHHGRRRSNFPFRSRCG
jgi:hypothetical protein